MRELTGTLLYERDDRSPSLWESWQEPFFYERVDRNPSLWESWQEPFFMRELTGTLFFERAERNSFHLWESWQEPLLKSWQEPFFNDKSRQGAEKNPLYERACSNPFYDTGSIRKYSSSKKLSPTLLYQRADKDHFVLDSCRLLSCIRELEQ